MSPVFFRKELEGVAIFWRIFRSDGVTLGFTGHDRDLYFDGIVHRAAPGMVPSAVRKTADFSPDSAEVEGALSHASICANDLAGGFFDNAQIIMGAVDWETLDHQTLYQGSLGTITQDGLSFAAELQSAKAQFENDFIPRTSPTCRAQFCGPGCALPAPKFSTEASLSEISLSANAVSFSGIHQPSFVYGTLRWFDGPQAGLRFNIVDQHPSGLVLDAPLSSALNVGTRAHLIQGCDHVLATCSVRFGNAINFQGEPFLPGNDFLARYPQPQ